jgi:hypothetical protein
MKYFLFGGAPSTGKTGAITRLVDEYLVKTKNFVYKDVIKLSNDDFRCVLEGEDKNNQSVKIIVISASDQPSIINYSIQYMKKHLPCDFIISVVRDKGDVMRDYFLKKMNITKADFCFELPLAKITRKRANRKIALKWYEENIDVTAQTILAYPPFNI